MADYNGIIVDRDDQEDLMTMIDTWTDEDEQTFVSDYQRIASEIEQYERGLQSAKAIVEEAAQTVDAVEAEFIRAKDDLRWARQHMNNVIEAIETAEREAAIELDRREMIRERMPVSYPPETEN